MHDNIQHNNIQYTVLNFLTIDISDDIVKANVSSEVY